MTNVNTKRVSKRREGGLRPETLASSLMVVLVVNALQRSVGLGRSLLFGRWLEPAELGHWEMALGFLMLAAPLAVLGLPGSFGRYLERYRQQGRLGLFLRRTASWTFVLAASVLALMSWRSDAIATLVFGDPRQAALAEVVVACLAIVITHHFLEAVFAGLRMFRVVSAMHFTQSMMFALVSLALLAWWRDAAVSVVIGYGLACLISILGVSLWTFARIERQPDSGEWLAHHEFWPPLMRFAIWVWVTNLLTNVFSIVDRYMILHCGGFGAEQALTQVGNYHSSHMVPVLLVSVANLMVGAMTPHLSHDWESGRREAVSERLNLGLKLLSVVMLVAGVGVLLLCPLLFHYVFQDKYAAGLEVLPWTLAGCVWFSLLLVAQTYVWCAERSRRAALPLLLGIAVNVGLNLALLPVLGLLGALVATALATLMALLAQLEVNRRIGMRVQRNAVLISLTPGLLVLGAAPAAIGAIALVTLTTSRGWVLNAHEREVLLRTLRDRLPHRRLAEPTPT
ncbi:lipopolysaccharide biosynthesis protein [Botrimarina hoheduenensis]|uniref:MurJ-like flippase n=1 Tax=Botrimarina hoheduenensis TaxID=2528000 RepID=A0A5C5WDI6_9BACT|nr:lipopolysaccharide biosynthesis protein [Botrimarina hoheduenensis]TWT48754.1 MurJ-like flippase [Botrimarina hoheduenensis]